MWQQDYVMVAALRIVENSFAPWIKIFRTSGVDEWRVCCIHSRAAPLRAKEHARQTMQIISSPCKQNGEEWEASISLGNNSNYISS